jgi:hypothetical protein
MIEPKMAAIAASITMVACCHRSMDSRFIMRRTIRLICAYFQSLNEILWL